jgi:uncharacterized membrane protein YphA (DoxX/SURF4 family)
MSSPDATGRIMVSAPDPKDPAKTDVQQTREAEAAGHDQTKGWIFGRYLHPTDGPTFSSEGYQRNASGPLADRFRNLIPDVDSREDLDLDKVKESWRLDRDRIVAHFGFNDAQKKAADEALAKQDKAAQDYFEDPATRENIRKYLDDLDSLARLDAKPKKMSYEIERYYDARKSLEADRKALVAPVDSWARVLRDSWVALATPEQAVNAGPYQPPLTEVERADKITMYGLTICGLALMLGLFTPIAALGAAGFLALFYLSMPPFPGLPVPSNAEGHYIFVNKNLIELLACLVIASTPNGLWIGLDALLFGWIDRIRMRRAARREQAAFNQAVREAAGLTDRGVVVVEMPKKPKSR